MDSRAHHRLVRLVQEALAISERESLPDCAESLREALAAVPEPATAKDPRHLARKLGSFTVTELADAMNVARPTADKAIRKMMDNGTVRDTGLARKHGGPGRPAPVYEYVTVKAKPVVRPKREAVEVEAAREMKLIEPRKGPVGSGNRVRPANAEIRALVEAARREGCRVKVSGGNHFVVYAPGGTVTLPKTPSDHRAVLNCRSQLRRAGIPV